MNGTLYKYTNFAKGWQRRYFVLDGTTLHYYLREPADPEQATRKARGSLPIVGAMITPSDEDGHGFTVSASNGDVYKLKASDARNRQLWVDHLRSSAGGALLPHPSDPSLQPNSSYFSECDQPDLRIYDQISNARDRVTAARKHLTEIEDKCDQLPLDEVYMKIMSYGHSAIVSLERAIDIADRTYLFGKTEQLRTHNDACPSISLDKEESCSDTEDEIKVEWVKEDVDGETLDGALVEFNDEQRANMVSLMQQIPYGGSLLSESWPGWLTSSKSGAQIVAQLCRHSPKSADPIELVKWILALKIPSVIFPGGKVPAASSSVFECKFDEKRVTVERRESTFTVTIQSAITVSFRLAFDSVYRGPGKPFLVEIKIKELQIGECAWVVAEAPLVKVQHALSAPKLSWHGHWLLKNRALAEEIQINYAGEEVSGHLRNASRMVAIDGSINRPRLDGDFFKLHESTYYVRQ